MGLNVGALDREIVVQTATKTQDDDTGEEVLTWCDDETIWAQWLDASTTEVYRAQQRLEATIAGIYRVYDMETRPTPEGSRIIGHDGRTYDVKGVIEIGRGEGLEIAVVAVA